MEEIAQEKRKYFEVLISIEKQTYSNKNLVREMFDTFKKSEWTFYMSIKRRMVKRNKHNKARLNRLINAGKKTPEE